MTWRQIIEREHRLMYEVLAAADEECNYINETGCCHAALVGDMIEFFSYFGDGLHDPKEEGLLYARCHRRGMTDEDEPLEQLLGEHEWSKGLLNDMHRTVEAYQPPGCRCVEPPDASEVVFCHGDRATRRDNARIPASCSRRTSRARSREPRCRCTRRTSCTVR